VVEDISPADQKEIMTLEDNDKFIQVDGRHNTPEDVDTNEEADSNKEQHDV
jgi:hypothetical protein